MKRRNFLFTAVTGAAILSATHAHALEYYPNENKKNWAILFGSRYGTARDASVWISEGMGGIAQVYDARENPDLGGFDHIVIGSGIYGGKAAQPLQDYMAKSGESLVKKICALFVCRGGGDNRPKPYIPMMQNLCKVEPLASMSFPGRLTKILLEPDVFKSMEGFYKSQNRAFEDSDKLVRKDCLAFGKEILEAVAKTKLS